MLIGSDKITAVALTEKSRQGSGGEGGTSCMRAGSCLGPASGKICILVELAAAPVPAGSTAGAAGRDQLMEASSLLQTGWMMWNWLVSALATGASVVLYDGSPLIPSPNVLWDLTDRLG